MTDRKRSEWESSVEGVESAGVGFSFREILAFIKTLENDPTATQKRRRIISEVTSGQWQLRGNFYELKALVDYLSRIGDNKNALDICLHHLQKVGSNDLLAMAIEQSRKAGPMEYEHGQKCINRAMATDCSCWSHRLFEQCIYFLMQKAHNDPAKAQSFWRDAEKLARKYQIVFQGREEGFYLLAKLKDMQNSKMDAIDELRIAIFEKTRDEIPQSRICPRCCVFLLGLLEGSNEYAVIKRIADIGMQYENMGKNRFYVAYRKADAMDRLLWADRTLAQQNEELWMDEAEKVLKAYDEAYEMYRCAYGKKKLTTVDEDGTERDYPVRDFLDSICRSVQRYDRVNWQDARPHWSDWINKFN